MIIDSLANARQYISLHRRFQKSFQFKKYINLDTIEAGNYKIDGKDIHTAVSVKDGVNAADAKYDAHNLNMDIRVCPTGSETIGWKPRKNCTNIKAPFNAEKDEPNYDTTADKFFQLKPGNLLSFSG